MILLAMVLSWAGFVVHNFADLPGQTLLSPDTLYPTLVFVILAVAWVLKPARLSASLLQFWAGLNRVGGGVLSVLPLSIWPFDPAQTWSHYGFHVLYGLSQVPAVILLWRYLRRQRRRPE